jgi:hypothetical protein
MIGLIFIFKCSLQSQKIEYKFDVLVWPDHHADSEVNYVTVFSYLSFHTPDGNMDLEIASCIKLVWTYYDHMRFCTDLISIWQKMCTNTHWLTLLTASMAA